ncbi:MAG: archease [Planctomycetes bacterium]|nr:archease [Planctomycetota bacterium]
MSHEVFEHTADLGVRVRAPDRAALYAESGQALFEILVDDLGAVRPATALEVAVAGDDAAYLLHDWLGELLYLFTARNLLLCAFDVRLAHSGLTGTVRGEVLDRTRHRLAHEVKAITYHGLEVRQDPGGWSAEFVVDI